MQATRKAHMTQHGPSVHAAASTQRGREVHDGVSEGPWYADKALLLLLLGVAIMFGQTFYNLLTVGLWTNPQFSHGPIVFLVALYLFGKRWNEIYRRERYAPTPGL